MTKALQGQTDWLSQYLGNSHYILWSHNMGGHGPKTSGVTAPPPKPFETGNPFVIFIRRWRWTAFCGLVLALNVKFITDAGPVDYTAMMKWFLIGLLFLLCGYVFMRSFSVKFKLTENRHVFHHGIITKTGVLLINEAGERAELSYGQIKSVDHDYEQGARALKIITQDDKHEYILFGAADFGKAITIIRGHIN